MKQDVSASIYTEKHEVISGNDKYLHPEGWFDGTAPIHVHKTYYNIIHSVRRDITIINYY